MLTGRVCRRSARRSTLQQECLHAQQKRRVLLVLQGMDTSGKDGTNRSKMASRPGRNRSSIRLLKNR
jgi:polyphosphate kinase 2 (PPK2 family)